MRTLTITLCSLALVVPALARDEAPSADFLRRASQWLESVEPGRCQAACRSFLQLGPEAMPTFRKALEKARKAQNKRLGRIVGDPAANPYCAHNEIARELDDERERIIGLIRTDYHKDSSKIKMLRNQMEDLERLYQRTMRLAEADCSRFDAAIAANVAALCEISRQLERFDPDSPTRSMDSAELCDHILADNIDSQDLAKERERLHTSLSELKALAEAESDNAAAGSWATTAMRDFTTRLNQQRALLGLGPLRLEEKLSAAARGHSQDMASMGFFSHTSPIAEKSSPAQRAKLAGYSGRWSGENIFMGSSSPDSAYNGWFGSDGHRFIMFAGGPNVIGVGVGGKHWTMMTGKLSR